MLKILFCDKKALRQNRVIIKNLDQNKHIIVRLLYNFVKTLFFSALKHANLDKLSWEYGIKIYITVQRKNMIKFI